MNSVTEKKVCIFTTFNDDPEAYSLNIIVKGQIKMLLNHGYKPTVIVAESFVAAGIYADKRVTLAHIPNVAVHNEVKKDDSFDEDVESLTVALKDILKDCDIVLTHDIIYQPACLKHNFAARKVADDLPSLRWMHWIHSATSPATLVNLRPVFSDQYIQTIAKPFPNSFYIFFNDYMAPVIARNYDVPENVVKIIHHPSDLKDVFGLTDDVAKLNLDKKLYSADVICLYPIRLDRGKQVEKVIKTIAMLKDFQLSVKLIIVDFHSTGGDKVTYRDELKNIAIDYGLAHDEIIWTSEYKEIWSVEVPYIDVMAMMRLSNVFIQASASESYSLTTQEAGLNKDVLVLNHDWAPFRDIFGPNAIYRRFSSRMDIALDQDESMERSTDVKYGPDTASEDERKEWEKKYHKGTAGKIAAQLKNKSQAMAMFLRKYRNPEYIFEKEFEPLFWEEMK